MRRLVLLSIIAVFVIACGGDESTDGAAGEDGTPGFATGTPDGEAQGADGGVVSDALAPPNSSADATETPDAAEVPCELTTGMCPNACTHGESLSGESCVTDAGCGCGLCCGFGQCKPFDAQGCESFASLTGCLCPGDDPGSDPVDPTNDIPWRVEPTNYMDDCSTKTPVGSDCNPFCQLGCPAGAHCALVDDERFTCVTSGGGVLGSACENSSECSAWFSCFGTFDAPEDTCQQVCDADEECPSGLACNLDIQFGGNVNVSFCDTALIPCNLWMPDCPQDMKCVISAGAMVCTASTYDGIEGYPCTDLGDCALGLLCVGLGCTPFCSTADTTPLGGTSCGEMCAAGYQLVDQVLQVGRCSTSDQQ